MTRWVELVWTGESLMWQEFQQNLDDESKLLAVV